MRRAAARRYGAGRGSGAARTPASHRDRAPGGHNGPPPRGAAPGGGATPDASGAQAVISLKRLNRIRGVDPHNNTITVEAGVVLAEIQARAQSAQRLFPLSLAAEGSCTIGGNLSTNAGGTGVLRYGNTRELCLGLEVVTAQGELWDGVGA